MRVLTASAVLCVAVVFGFASSATAILIPLSATMDGASANAGAGTGSPGTGTGTITFDTVTKQLSWSVTWGGLIGTAAAMHFHGPALVNQNVGVQVSVGVAGPPVIGNAILNATQESNLLSGLWYLNLHTNSFPGGEIRGQVLIPEPSTLALLLCSVGLVAATRRRLLA